MKHPLRREDGSVVYNCCWSSLTPSLSGPSPARLMTTFYCLRVETHPTWRDRSPYLCPPGTGWPSYTPQNWVPLLSPRTTRRATVEVFEAASTRDCLCNEWATALYTLFSRYLRSRCPDVKGTSHQGWILTLQILVVLYVPLALKAR
jgi:hypothetical protein